MCVRACVCVCVCARACIPGRCRQMHSTYLTDSRMLSHQQQCVLNVAVAHKLVCDDLHRGGERREKPPFGDVFGAVQARCFALRIRLLFLVFGLLQVMSHHLCAHRTRARIATKGRCSKGRQSKQTSETNARTRPQAFIGQDGGEVGTGMICAASQQSASQPASIYAELEYHGSCFPCTYAHPCVCTRPTQCARTHTHTHLSLIHI